MENTSNKPVKWVVDPSHSEITFKVKHLMISNVKGEFKSFTASIEHEDFLKGPVSASIETASVFTNNNDRDNHLRSADFFDSENHPAMTFESTSFSKIDEEAYLLKGMLTIRGISREVELDVEFGGINTDPWGNVKAGFSFEGKINRKDWGLNWNAALETGGVLVSDEVKVAGEIQLVKQGA
ncbi:MAG: YceI family protein [Bacteroidales bacterium]